MCFWCQSISCYIHFLSSPVGRLLFSLLSWVRFSKRANKKYCRECGSVNEPIESSNLEADYTYIWEASYSIFHFSLRRIIGFVWSNRHTHSAFISQTKDSEIVRLLTSFVCEVNERWGEMNRSKNAKGVRHTWHIAFSISFLRYGRFQREKGQLRAALFKIGIWNMDTAYIYELEYGIYRLHLDATINHWKYGIWTDLDASVVGLKVSSRHWSSDL